MMRPRERISIEEKKPAKLFDEHAKANVTDGKYTHVFSSGAVRRRLRY